MGWWGFIPPPGVRQVDLCAVSGQLPAPCCEHRRPGWFIPGISPIAPCRIHREIVVDPATGYRVAKDDGSRVLRREVAEFWPANMLALFRQAGVPRREVPSWEPGTGGSRTAGDEAPRITSPRAALVYALRANDPSRQAIPLRAETASGVQKLFWFAGASFLGSSEAGAPLFWKASPGHWKVHVLDDQGRSSTCDVRVELVP